jgi:uncharacterized membrane protein
MARKDINLSIYIIVKLGMIYCIYYLNWVGLLGYTIATIFAYINDERRLTNLINKYEKTLKVKLILVMVILC